jgi:hypothetical protein
MSKVTYNKVSRFPGRHWIVYLYCLPTDIVAWLLVSILALITGGTLFWRNGLWCSIQGNSWWCRSLASGYAGGTLGHGGWLRAHVVGNGGIATRTEFHEHIHVEQYEALMLFVTLLNVGWLTFLGITQGLTLYPILFSLLVQVFGGLLGLCASWITAWLRGASVYRGSVHEEDAYSREKEFKYVRH